MNRLGMITVIAGLLAGTVHAKNDGDSSGWTSRPGIPRNPAVSQETWQTSPFRDFYDTPGNWDESGVMGFVKGDSTLPNILLVGDSISMGYTVDVRQMLEGSANVYRIIGNGGDTERFLTNYQRYLGQGTTWDLIHFNWGLHDLVRADGRTYDSTKSPRRTTEEYATNLEKCVGILESTGAHLIWASTTPVPEGSIGRVPGDEVERNKAAEAVMKKHHIEINDLYTLMKAHPEHHAGPGNVHFTGAGSHLMAKQIVEAVQRKLGITALAETQRPDSAKLVNHWRFEGDLKDSMTGQVSAEANKASFSFNEGQRSQCLFSTGISRQTLDLGIEPGGLKNISITMWINVASVDSAAAVVLSKNNGQEQAGWEICLRKGSGTEAGIWWRIGGTNTYNLRYDRPALRFGQWHHLAVTFEEKKGTAVLYIDGNMITRASGIAQSPCNKTGQMQISHARYPFKGCLDDLQVWDGVLTESQIKAMVNQEGG